MSLHPDDHQWATGGPPDVATSSGPPDVALAVGTRMLACGCTADADIKWPTGCTHPVVHPMCTHPVVHRMRHIQWSTGCGTFGGPPRAHFPMHEDVTSDGPLVGN